MCMVGSWAQNWVGDFFSSEWRSTVFTMADIEGAAEALNLLRRIGLTGQRLAVFERQ